MSQPTYLQVLGARARAKYRARPTLVEGIRFASGREARRYEQLRLLERAGAIAALELQPRYALEALNVRTGEVVRIGYYVADFRYWDRASGVEVVEDAKGFKTPLYKWKKAHAETQYGITIVET